jgi:maltose/moltooligosaccharide transporter
MPNSPVLWFAAMMLWVMDASINISMEPFRALVADLLPSEQRTTGFAVQSFFIGIGAVIASAFPYLLTNLLGVPNTAPAGEIPPSVAYAFYAGAVAFIGAVGWTVFRTREYPPENMEEFERRRREHKGFIGGAGEILSSLRAMPATMAAGRCSSFPGSRSSVCGSIQPAVTQHVFHATDPTTVAYNEGADWVGVLFAVYNGCAALVAFAIPWLARRTSRKVAHMISLFCGALGLLSMAVISSPTLLLLSMVGVGIAWASILSMPYAILAGALPPERTGVYMGIFNFFIVIPQIVAAGILGLLMSALLGNDPMRAVVLGDHRCCCGDDVDRE